MAYNEEEPNAAKIPGSPSVGQSGSDVLTSPKLPMSEWWPVEVWRESREVFKALLMHSFNFGLAIGCLEVIHYLIKLASFAPDREGKLEKIDFYAIACALIVFCVSFIFKLLILGFGTKK